MEYEIITNFIKPESFILIPALYLIGLFLKQTPGIPEWSYAWIILLIGSFSCFLYYGWEIQSFIQGVLCAGIAVLSKDLIHLPISAVKDKINQNKEDN